MVILMSNDSGRYVADDFGAFVEEVLNAQWLPQQPALQLGLQQTDKAASKIVDAEAFLRNVYLSQE